MRVTWMMTNWCNYACSYCGVQTFSRREAGKTYGHAFDYYSVERWIEAFRKFPQEEIYLKITGGEPFLDRSNIVRLINELNSFPNIRHIRVDTTGFWNPKSFGAMRKEKLLLNMSYHHSQIALDRFLANALKIRVAGFTIPIINFVMAPESYPSFEECYQVFEHHDFLVNASAMAPAGAYAGRSMRESTEIQLLKKYAAPIDVKYKVGAPPTKGRLCLHPSLSYNLNFDGNISVDCIGEPHSIFDDDLPALPTTAVPCPRDTCFGCIEMYRELLDEPLALPGKGLCYLTDFADEIRQWRTSGVLKESSVSATLLTIRPDCAHQ
jgi:MoaA/NifB/PqqE/SkfB family radical SAM enzyme